MKESDYLTLLCKLEQSDAWGFGDAFELLCFPTHVLVNAFKSGRAGFEKIDTALRDVWTTIEDSISDGEIKIKSGKLIDLSAGPIQTENSNTLVVEKKSFLAWYRRNKERIAQYLSCADLKFHGEKFLDRLANNEPLKFITKNSHPTTNKTKMDWLRKKYISSVAKRLKVKPDLQLTHIRDDYSLQKLIRGSGLLENKQPTDSTLQRWIGMARKDAKIKSKIGTPIKAVKKQR